MSNLIELGFSPFFSKQLKDFSDPELVPARISIENRGNFEVIYEGGVTSAAVSGKLYYQLFDDSLPTVGDWVGLRLAPDNNGLSLIEHVFKRKTVFTRGGFGNEKHKQVIAANIDQVFLVCGLDGDYNLNRIERYLAQIWSSGADPLIILNKADLYDDCESFVNEVETHSPGVKIILSSALNSEGLTEIKSCIKPGNTAAFVGSSGVGKSTLVNKLLGKELMAVNAVRDKDSRGRHTTTFRQLITIPMAGMIIDTPGMRLLSLDDDQGILNVFSDIEKIAKNCRFRDCTHKSEPGCAVLKAIDNGELPLERYNHYLKLDKEAQANKIRHNEYLKRKSEKVWGKLYSEGNMIRKFKGNSR